MQDKKTELEYKRTQNQKIIEQKFIVSYMNDAKWVKLINCLVQKSHLFNCCEVKLVWDEGIRFLLIDENTQYDFDYYDHAMEAMITGKPLGWYDYKEIEWLNFPPTAEILINENNIKAGTKKVAQDLHSLEREIRKVGQFELFLNENGLKILNYR